MQIGKLKRWNDDKGFGFIEPRDRGGDVFIHISALKRMARRPKVGDVVVYETHRDGDGKARAVNAAIEGVAQIKPRPVQRDSERKNKNDLFSKILLVALFLFLGLVAYNKFVLHGYVDEMSVESMPYSSLGGGAERNYSCEGKVYCSEMTSCDEARFYQNNCPGTKMDGDGDGVPCESQWCDW